MKEIIQTAVQKHLPEVTALRRKLHQIPEIAGKEYKTGALLREKLGLLPALEVRKPFLETDVTALLGDRNKKNLTLRADMDGLPITEKNTFEYRSTHDGFMHACGHDGHMAMLYGAALVLHDLKEKLPCNVRFLFQPGEEVACMAKDLLEAGALEKPEPDFVAGLHSWPNVKHGVFSSRVGAVMAAAGFFTLRIRGKGGHGSLPHLARNPLESAAKIILESKKIVPQECVLTFCAVNGGSNTNVIPGEALLQGTIRYLDENKGQKMVQDFKELLTSVQNTDQVECILSCDIPYPVTLVPEQGYIAGKACVETYLGPESFTEMEKSSMSSEDFAFYLQKYNGIFCHLGYGQGKAPLHSDVFDFDDTLLEKGMIFYASLAFSMA